MRIPESLVALLEDGILQDVIRPLLSGKEAEVYLVVADDKPCVAKVYKEAANRSFKNRAAYAEGRKVRNSRDQRAMAKRSHHGRAKEEAAWRSTEVDMIYLLRDAGVRVPVPYHFINGVLIMELVQDAHGNPAPRLGEVRFTRDGAVAVYQRLLTEVVRMLSAGVVHGDLSDFNVLMAADGPVIIDFPQSVHASTNQNARKLLLRDVNNLHRFVQRFDPDRKTLPYGEELWQLYEKGELAATTKLTGAYAPAHRKADTALVVSLIDDATRDEMQRREARGSMGHRRGARTQQPPTAPGPVRKHESQSARGVAPPRPAAGQSSGGPPTPNPTRRKRRRRTKR